MMKTEDQILLETVAEEVQREYQMSGLFDGIHREFTTEVVKRVLVKHQARIDLCSTALGKTAYDAYCAKRGWKSLRGEPLPQFDQQAPDLQDAWIAAAMAVVATR